MLFSRWVLWLFSFSAFGFRCLMLGVSRFPTMPLVHAWLQPSGSTECDRTWRVPQPAGVIAWFPPALVYLASLSRRVCASCMWQYCGVRPQCAPLAPCTLHPAYEQRAARYSRDLNFFSLRFAGTRACTQQGIAWSGSRRPVCSARFVAVGSPPP